MPRLRKEETFTAAEPNIPERKKLIKEHVNKN